MFRKFFPIESSKMTKTDGFKKRLMLISRKRESKSKLANRKKRSHSIPLSRTVWFEMNYESLRKELSISVKLNNQMAKVKFENSACQ